MTDENDQEFQTTSIISRLNRKQALCDAERAVFSRHGKHRAFYCLDFEGQVRKSMKLSGKAYSEMIRRLDEIDGKFGHGLHPKLRTPPEKVTKDELEARYEVVTEYQSETGYTSIPRKGGTPVPVIKMSEENPFFWLRLLIAKRIENIKNCIILFVGDTGSAKTYSSIDLARDLARFFGTFFDLEGVCMDEESFFNRMGEEEENVVGRVTVADDMSQWANSREYGGDINILLAKMFDIFRSRGEIIILTTPKETKIDKSIRENIHIYLVAPDKEQQGLFLPGNPLFDEKGKIKDIKYYKFEGEEVFGSEGAKWEDLTLSLDSVRFPFLGMREMNERAMETYEKRYKRPPQKGRDFYGRPWPVDPFLRSYELKKKREFGEAIKEGKKLMELTRKKKELERLKIDEQMADLEWKKEMKERKKKDQEDQLALKEAKRQAEYEKMNRRGRLLCPHCGNIYDFEGKGDKKGYTKCRGCRKDFKVADNKMPEFRGD